VSRKYKFHNKEGLYFVSFATVYWVDVFIRDEYFDLIIQSLDFCRKNKGMEIYAYCIMTSHVHLIFRAKEANPGDILRDFKSFILRWREHEPFKMVMFVQMRLCQSWQLII